MTKIQDGELPGREPGMMKGLSTLITLQALLATISGIMMANMSLMGKVGIFFFYRDYAILKVWWKTALLLFGLQLLLIFVLWLSKRLLSKIGGLLVALLFLALIIVGAYFTYLDFTTTSHRYLRSEFHIGGYLFWAAGAITCLYFLFVKIKRNLTPIKRVDSPDMTNEKNENH